MIQFHQAKGGYSLSVVTRKMAFIWELNYTSVFEKKKLEIYYLDRIWQFWPFEKGGVEAFLQYVQESGIALSKYHFVLKGNVSNFLD